VVYAGWTISPPDVVGRSARPLPACRLGAKRMPATSGGSISCARPRSAVVVVRPTACGPGGRRSFALQIVFLKASRLARACLEDSHSTPRGLSRHPPRQRRTSTDGGDSVSSGHIRVVAFIREAVVSDGRRMSDHVVCPECGSSSLIACGVYEHGTWQYRLSCWTCRDCRAVVGVAEAAIDPLRA
jgi:hypothetical protein